MMDRRRPSASSGWAGARAALLGVVALVLCFAGLGLAAAPVDFSGTWVLDKEASSGLDALLEAQGMSYLERKVVLSLDVKQIINQSGDTMILEIRSIKDVPPQTLRMDGVVREVKGERGVAKVSHHWEGEALVTQSEAVDEDGAPVSTRITRTLQDEGRTMLQRMAVTTADGRTYVVDRVFRRQ